MPGKSGTAARHPAPRFALVILSGAHRLDSGRPSLPDWSTQIDPKQSSNRGALNVYSCLFRSSAAPLGRLRRRQPFAPPRKPDHPSRDFRGRRGIHFDGHCHALQRAHGKIVVTGLQKRVRRGRVRSGRFAVQEDAEMASSRNEMTATAANETSRMRTRNSSSCRAPVMALHRRIRVTGERLL